MEAQGLKVRTQHPTVCPLIPHQTWARTLHHTSFLKHITPLRRANGPVTAHEAKRRLWPGRPTSCQRQQRGIHPCHGIADLSHQRCITALQCKGRQRAAGSQGLDAFIASRPHFRHFSNNTRMHCLALTSAPENCPGKTSASGRKGCKLPSPTHGPIAALLRLP